MRDLARDSGRPAALTRRAFVAGVAALAVPPVRAAVAAPRGWPEIQFDFDPYVGPARTVDGVVVRFPPVFTRFVTVRLGRRPSAHDRSRLAAGLAAVERRFAFAPRGVMAMVGYGRPYFGAGAPFSEAVSAPTDPRDVVIERNDMLLVLRSDTASHLDAAERMLVLDGLMHVSSRRDMFIQPGLPRRVADAHALPCAASIDPRSPLWMGFSDQQVGASAPARAIAFRSGRFAGGAILHLSHLVEDLAAWYARSPGDRVQSMFRSNPPPPATVYVENTFRDAGDARAGLAATGRLGHLAAVQRASRAPDGTPLHIRLDGPGFDALDVAAPAPKLHFAILVPSAERFARMRRLQAAQDLGAAGDRNGIEGFVRATRRQNFLIPPRRSRAFPSLDGD